MRFTAIASLKRMMIRGIFFGTMAFDRVDPDRLLRYRTYEAQSTPFSALYGKNIQFFTHIKSQI
jgi:hypothetical protein